MNPPLRFDDADSDAVDDTGAKAPGEDLLEVHDDPYAVDPADATDQMLEVIAAVDFLRRGDRPGITLWAAIDEALRWWVSERTALLDGYTAPELRSTRLGDGDPLQATLTQLIATAGQDEPVPISTALQQALRRWSTVMADRYNGQHPWPPPASRVPFPPHLRLVQGSDESGDVPPDLIA